MPHATATAARPSPLPQPPAATPRWRLERPGIGQRLAAPGSAQQPWHGICLYSIDRKPLAALYQPALESFL